MTPAIEFLTDPVSYRAVMDSAVMPVETLEAMLALGCEPEHVALIAPAGIGCRLHVRAMITSEWGWTRLRPGPASGHARLGSHRVASGSSAVGTIRDALDDLIGHVLACAVGEPTRGRCTVRRSSPDDGRACVCPRRGMLLPEPPLPEFRPVARLLEGPV